MTSAIDSSKPTTGTALTADVRANFAAAAAEITDLQDASTYDATGSAAVILHDYIEDDGAYNVMGFVPQNLKSAIRSYTSTTDVHTYAQLALDAAISDGHGVRFPRGRYVAPGLAIASYTGDGLIVEGVGALIRLGANETGLAISSSQNVVVKGLKFDATAISGASQIAVKLTDSARVRVVDNDFRLLTYGVNFITSALGLATQGNIPIPSIISRNLIKGCAAGVLLGGTSTAAEYAVISNNIINDCTVVGVLNQAGNVRISNNSITGNVIGIEIDGSIYSNGDHGAVTGNTINHNSSCGLYVHDLNYSMLISGNNIWANIYSNLGAYGTSFGVALKTVKNVNLTGNIIARNIVNLGLDVITSSIIANNSFIAYASTTYNIKEITTVTIANGNKMGPNTFEGVLSGAANNNDYEQMYVIGASGAPAFQNTWANLGAGFGSAAYFKDAVGVVHLSGVMAGPINSVAFTLPAGFRPAAKIKKVNMSNNLVGGVEIGSDGTVNPNTGSNVYSSLDGISFKAEA